MLKEAGLLVQQGLTAVSNRDFSAQNPGFSLLQDNESNYPSGADPSMHSSTPSATVWLWLCFESSHTRTPIALLVVSRNQALSPHQAFPLGKA